MSSTPISRTEPVSPERAVRPDATPLSRAQPRRDARADFETALQRAGRSPSKQNPAQEEPEDRPAGVVPDATLPPWQAAALPPPRPTVEAPAWTPRAQRPADAVSTYLNALQLPPGSSVPGQWKLQLLDSSLPVQQLDIQRSPAGGLRLALSASPEAARAAPLERLRQRLTARGSAPESLVYRNPKELEP
jgi:hypothetical protein